MADHDHDQQDRMLPIANVGRIMKQILPPSAKISKEAKQTMQECATEFISFVTGEASDRCRKENRKTVNGDDVCWALSNLGFDNYAENLSRYLLKIREAERERANQIGRGKGESPLGYSKGEEIGTDFGSSTSPNTLMEFKIIDNLEDRHKSLLNSS